MEQVLPSILTAIISISVSYGILKTKIESLESKTDEQKHLKEDFIERIYKLREVYVTHDLFREIIQSIKEDHKELKHDVKQILEMLQSKQ